MKFIVTVDWIRRKLYVYALENCGSSKYSSSNLITSLMVNLADIVTMFNENLMQLHNVGKVFRNLEP